VLTVRRKKKVTANLPVLRCGYANGSALGSLSRLLLFEREREPAHVHVRSNDREVKLWLHDLSVAVNVGFPAHELGDIIRHVRLNRKTLLDAWNEHFGN
jgi:hypothetical protein